ncbi:hypothetical protein PX699_12675, partial [Sphingobium sp. H39-3-25]|uniref:hypothetical protein n=1 Tax=Sphingobium arseniciresistens TaxID=3030834 RepID=UPI0023B8894D|nr:hypothetical protein [Sphingobium arseniciresistens]
QKLASYESPHLSLGNPKNQQSAKVVLEPIHNRHGANRGVRRCLSMSRSMETQTSSDRPLPAVPKSLPGADPFAAGPISIALSLWMLPWEIMAATMASMAIQAPGIDPPKRRGLTLGKSEQLPPQLRVPPELEEAERPDLFA